MQTKSNTIIVALTDARPVRINPDAWPVIANAREHRYDGQYDFQANRHWRYKLITRQHQNGCALVYGIHHYETQWQGEHCLTMKAGIKLTPGDDIIAAINLVADDMESQVEDGTFLRLARECIGDLPAEDLDCQPKPKEGE